MMDMKEKIIRYGETINKGELSEKFSFFFSKLIEYNKMFNLTSITEKNEVYNKHFIDSVAGEFLFKKGASVIEIGSGAGFPSIPLKLIRPDLSFVLVESTGKKCGFLRTIVDSLSLKDMKVLNVRAEDLARDASFREKFDCVTARAVAKMNTLSEYCLPFLKLGGSFIAYKGNVKEELKEAENAVSLLGGEIKEVINYSIEGGEERSLVEVVKVRHTPEQYPRGNGKERTKPL